MKTKNKGCDTVLTQKEFVTMSLNLNLFFLRIMKEHSLFLGLGFTPKDSHMAVEASEFRMGFERLLAEATRLANGNVDKQAAESQQFITQYTMEAERLTYFYTGVPIDSSVTYEESMLTADSNTEPAQRVVEAVEMLDRKAYQMTAALAEFKFRLLSNVRSCKMFTFNYPLLIEHILREARFFMNMLALLVNGDSIMKPEDVINQEVFWNRIMAEHAKFIAGLLDPSEEALIDTARMFGESFDKLTAEATQATKNTMEIAKVTDDSLAKTRQIRDFKSAGTSGILECKIQSIIIPLLGDHVLREANHYLYVLEMSK